MANLFKYADSKNISLPNMLILKGLTDHWWEPLIEYTIYEKPKEKVIILEGTEKYEYKYSSKNFFICLHLQF